MTLKRKVGDKVKVVAEKHGHEFELKEVVTIVDTLPKDGHYPEGYSAKNERGYEWFVTDSELADLAPLTPDEFYQKTRQLVRLQTLVEQIDETDTRSLTTSGADFLDEVKRLIEEIKVQLGLPKV